MEIVQTMNSDPGLAVGRSLFKNSAFRHQLISNIGSFSADRISHNHALVNVSLTRLGISALCHPLSVLTLLPFICRLYSI